jgi:hypothetical protein
MIWSKRQESQNVSSRYGLHLCKCKHNYKQTVHMEYSWDMMLGHWVIESQTLEEMYCPHLRVSICPRILAEHFDTWRWGQHVALKGHNPITQWCNVQYQNNGISAPLQQKRQNSQLLRKSKVVILFSIFMETTFSTYNLTLNYVHLFQFSWYLFNIWTVILHYKN